MGAWNTVYNNTLFGVRYHASNLTRLQEQVTTGNRINRLSDAPADGFRVLTLQDAQKTLEDFKSNLTEVELSLSEASNALQSISEQIARVGVLITQAANGTYGGANRQAMAEEIDQILEQCVALGNHQVMGRYIFGGQSTSSPPYEITRENGRIVSVRYTGSYRDLPIPVGPRVTMSGQLIGEMFFRNDQRQTPELYGATGAAVGSGTSSLRGDHWLRLTHATTTYEVGSGVAAGTDSAAGDTILGDDHTLTIDSGTIRLDNGSAVAYDGTETNLKLTNEVGDVVYVDLTGTPVDGTWTITATGAAALDDGTSVALTDFTLENFAVPDSNDSPRFLYLNTTDIQRTGTDAVTVPGTYDVFGTLIQARDVLLNTESLDESDQMEAIRRAADAVDDVGDGLRRRITIVGGRIGAVETLKNTLDNLIYNSESESASLQQADVTELAVQLARAETLYQVCLQVTSKTLSMSLLNYMMM